MTSIKTTLMKTTLIKTRSIKTTSTTKRKNASASKIFRIVLVTNILNINASFRMTLNNKKLNGYTIEVPGIRTILNISRVRSANSEKLRTRLKTPSVEARTGCQVATNAKPNVYRFSK